MTVTPAPVTAANWRDCAAVTVTGERDGSVVGFVMWAIDDDRSRWIGGLAVDTSHQRRGIACAVVRTLMDRFAAEPDCPNVALSYSPDNAAARELYLSPGFRETGETEDDELVARWTPVPAALTT